MSKHLFGWSLPPGAAGDPNAPWNQDDGPCPLCFRELDECICPECLTCQEIGNPLCYTQLPDFLPNPHHHGLTFSESQAQSREKQEEFWQRCASAIEQSFPLHYDEEPSNDGPK